MSIPEDQRNREEEFFAYLGGAADIPVDAPRNRKEEWYMYLGGDGDAPEGAPYNREEEWALWLKEHIGGGGGNPNRMVTITGTVGDPWGEYSIDEIVAMIEDDRNYTVSLLVNGVNVLFPRLGDSGINFGYAECYSPDDDEWDSQCLVYAEDSGQFVNGAAMDGILSDGDASIAPMTDIRAETTLTIIYHPLPEPDDSIEEV